MTYQPIQITVALCGALAEPDLPATGGYEASNARLIKACRNAGWSIEKLAYPSVHDLNSLRKIFAYLAGFYGIMRRIYRLKSSNRVHFTPFCRHFLAAELILVAWAARRGIWIVVDLRAGTKDKDFTKKGAVYRTLFRRLLGFADVVAVEGERYIPFVRSIRPDVPVYYLPNFLPDADIPHVPSARADQPIRFVYAGSVNEAKGVLEATKLVAALAKAGREVRFDVFGRIDPWFVDRVRTDVGAAPWLFLHGPQPFPAIRDALSHAHFFAFLSKWRGEGHSNALTEAMSQGAIPIVTDHGFNVGIAGPDAIVVAERTSISDIVAQVEVCCSDRAEMAARSARLVARVRERYSESAVTETLKKIYGIGML